MKNNQNNNNNVQTCAFSNLSNSNQKENINSNRDIKNTNYLYFLGGFAEGEGSNTVTINVAENFKYGVDIKPEFNVAQH
jgi:hypothetical protein